MRADVKPSFIAVKKDDPKTPIPENRKAKEKIKMALCVISINTHKHSEISGIAGRSAGIPDKRKSLDLLFQFSGTEHRPVQIVYIREHVSVYHMPHLRFHCQGYRDHDERHNELQPHE